MRISCLLELRNSQLILNQFLEEDSLTNWGAHEQFDPSLPVLSEILDSEI